MGTDCNDMSKDIITVIPIVIITMIIIILIAVKVENEKQQEREKKQTLKQINILGKEYNMTRTNLNRYVYVDKDGNEIEIDKHMAEQYKISEK